MDVFSLMSPCLVLVIDVASRMLTDSRMAHGCHAGIAKKYSFGKNTKRIFFGAPGVVEKILPPIFNIILNF